jgi:DNA helicase IV
MVGENNERELEQHNLDRLYSRVDELRAEATRELAKVRITEVGGNRQNRSERDAFATLYEDQLLRLRGAEEGLCFGRIDTLDSTTTYIGRIGISDAQHRQLLMDWRAPASEPFYRATAVDPGDIVLRRHLGTRSRRVVSIEDDVLNAQALAATGGTHLQGEGALIAALEAGRTGRMSDIVATIQAEQDAIIRKPLDRVVVVQGGPGTGKTAVALHRAAYLLYQHRKRIENSGVLIVGPSPTFLRYIEQVLPSLGETGAVLLTPGQLYPGVDTTLLDAPRASRIKGDLRMVEVIERAVAGYERVPREPQRLAVGRKSVSLTPKIVRSAMRAARFHSIHHNESRDVFASAVVDALAGQLAAPKSLGELSAEKRQEIYDDLRMSQAVKIAINLCWLPLTPRGVLDALLSKPAKLVAAADGILELTEMALIRRESGAPITVEDVPLLDEIAELIGTYTPPRRTGGGAEDEYAAAVLENTGTGAWLSASQLAARQRESTDRGTVAERALEDREWAFGHLVADEAQELSPMQLRLLFRRVPSKSATLVGDLAQARHVDVDRTWSSVLSPHVGKRFELVELTVSYRTPGRILEPANALLRHFFPQLSLPTPVRRGESDPWRLRLPDIAAIAHRLPELIASETAAVSGGKVALIVPAVHLRRVEEALTGSGLDYGMGTSGLDHTVAVLDPTAAKGLEFDSVVIVEPGLIAPSGDVSGVGELYVALSRSTARLGILDTAESVLDEVGFTSAALAA